MSFKRVTDDVISVWCRLSFVVVFARWFLDRLVLVGILPRFEVRLREFLAVDQRVGGAQSLHDARLRLIQQTLVSADHSRQGRLTDFVQLFCDS